MRRVITYRFVCLAVLAVALSPAVSRAQATLEVSFSTLTFTAVRDGDSPAAQSVAVTSEVTERIEFTAEVETTSYSASASWLRVSLRRGTTPARLQVSIDQSGLDTGEYAARIVVRSAYRTLPIDVTLSVVDAAPQLRVAPAQLRFDVGAAMSEQAIFVRNAGGGALPYRANVLTGGDWLSVDPTRGTTAPNQPGLVRVVVNSERTRSSDYGVVRVEAGTDTIDLPISVVRQPAGPILGVNLTGLRFEARENEGNANGRNVLILNWGEGSLNWQAQVLQGSEWLTLTTPNGRARRDELGRLGLNADPGAMPAGTYYALVRVAAPQSANSPQYISAILNIAPASAWPTPDPSPQGLFFVGDPSQAAPPTQPLRAFVSSRLPVQFQASATTSDGGDWLHVDPQSGVTTTENPPALRVSVKPSMLKPGVYAGEVTLAFANRTIRTTNVTLVVPSSGPSGLSAKSGPQAAGCSPSRLSLTQTGLLNNFSSAAGWPNALIVRLADDCGAPVLNANVVATFSNNDPPLSMQLTNPLVGLYSATWLPRGKGNVVVTTTASSPSLGVTRTEIVGGVTSSQEGPVASGGLVSNFDPEQGSPLAPGGPVQLFGSNLSSTSASAEGLPLPSTLARTSMLIGPTEVPLFFVSPDQMNAQIPPDLAVDQRHAVAILSGNRYTVADPLLVTAVRPALIASAGAVVARRSDASIVSSATPARAGEEITFVAAGLGATEPPVAAGEVPAEGVRARAQVVPSVTIGGHAAPVRSAVLAPDAVGIYLVTVQVPAGLAAGRQSVEIQQLGIASNRAMVSIGP